MRKNENATPKPCPFCGSDKVYIHSDHRGILYIQCSACRANTYVYLPDEDKALLLQKWNRRAYKEDNND